MNVRAHMSMLFHLDKCIGCHTCSVACKNLWTDRKGAAETIERQLGLELGEVTVLIDGVGG